MAPTPATKPRAALREASGLASHLTASTRLGALTESFAVRVPRTEGAAVKEAIAAVRKAVGRGQTRWKAGRMASGRFNHLKHLKIEIFEGNPPSVCPRGEMVVYLIQTGEIWTHSRGLSPFLRKYIGYEV